MKLSFWRKDKPKAACPTVERVGWEAYGLPAMSGNGFDYNAEGWLTGASGSLTEKSILQIGTAMACVRLLSQTIATLPIGLYRRMPDGTRRSARDNPLYMLLHNRPNATMTAVDFWQVVVAMMLLRGTAFVELKRLGGRVVSLSPITNGVITWEKNGSDYTFTHTVNGKSRKLARKDLWIIPAFTLDGMFGVSPICYGANVFSSAIAANKASNQTFQNGLSASGFVSFGKGATDWLTQDQRDQLRDNIGRFAHGGAKSGGVFVLEGGMGFTPLSMNPEDAQMLETRAFNVEEICRWYGVPPTLVGHGDKTSNWGTGLEQQNIAFLTYNLRPWLMKIEQSIWTNLIDSTEQATIYAEFNVEGLLRADTAGRSAWYREMVSNGMMTRDEVRVKENWEPMGGMAEVLTVQSAMIPLDNIGKAAE